MSMLTRKSGGGETTHNDNLRRLVRFYEFYAPERVNSAPLTLASYEGRVDLLFRALEKKYGPEKAILSKPLPDATVAAAASSTTQSGSSSSRNQPPPPLDLAKVLVVPPPLPSTFSTVINLNYHQLRLERYYRHYAQDKCESAASTIDAHRGQEDHLFRELERKYGAEPRAFLVVTPRRTKSLSNNNSAGGGNASASTAAAAGSVGDDDESSAFFADPAVVGPSAGPDPKTVAIHTPYDYRSVLRQLGLREDAVDRELSALGNPTLLPYAASLAVLATLIGQEALFDVDPDKTPPFPFHALKEVKRAHPDSIDGLAYDHLLRYRSVFTTALQHVVYVRQLEMLERQGLMQQHQRSVAELSRRILVLCEAVSQVVPLEEERRGAIMQEERIRLDGIVMWFRQHRLDIVAGRTTSFTPLGGEESSGSRGAAQHGKGILQLAEMEEQLRRVDHDIRAQSDALVAKWVQEPPPSLIRSMLALPSAIRSPSPSLNATASNQRSKHISIHPEAATPSRARFSNSAVKALNYSPALRTDNHADGLLAVARQTSPSSRTRSPHSSPSSLWVPSGPTMKSHNAIASARGFPAAADVVAVVAPPVPVVVRENLHYDPFGRDLHSSSAPAPTGFVTHDGLLLCAAPIRSPSANRRTASASATTVRSSSALFHHGGGLGDASPLAPFEIERHVRLKKLTTKGSFSAMRHCAAAEAKRYCVASE
ncbi:Hypothetical protein, putative [Bodo saltans]|uniref:Uncharacterized protein n=1 Tax=Bodo saltans TaxID=75058 RepID=A0A0S4J6J7_BODSA|nr:Hypothetical protein, putative [Bodo saltans]|eukprot:CUG87069.1 Hypothetical protein, putative [Bodo saltans]